ncbi:hypothetical protein KEM52_001254 [Ascosphaera acerosa]|nr:hypothetical protein KEM52_001254 [Ascosphaera acerosa]
MFAAKQSARAARTCVRQAQRRYASHAHEHHHHAEPVNVNLKPSLFITLAALPLGYSLYSWANSNPDAKPVITRLIERFTIAEEKLAQKNHIHTLAAERAAFDKQLFAGCKPDMNLQLLMPEMMNSSGTMNVPAGHGNDLAGVVAYYNAKNASLEQARQARMGNGKVQSIYDHAF